MQYVKLSRISQCKGIYKYFWHFNSADDESCAVAGEIYDESKAICKCGTADSCATPHDGKKILFTWLNTKFINYTYDNSYTDGHVNL